MYVVQDLTEQLWGGPATKAFNSLSKINTIKSDDHKYKKDSPSVFTCLEKLRHVYKIHLDETAQPFSIAAPPQTSTTSHEEESTERVKTI